MKDHVEYRIVNANGRVIHTFDDERLAALRLPTFGIGCQLVEVRETFTVLRENKPIALKPRLVVAA